MKLLSSSLVLLALTGTLLPGPAAAAEVAIKSDKPDKAAAPERSGSGQATAPKLKPVSSPEVARKDGKADAPGKARQLEIPVSVLPPPN
jgi:hypothetical protein